VQAAVTAAKAALKRSKKANPDTVSLTQQQEEEIERDVSETLAQLQAVHAAEVAEIASCREKVGCLVSHTAQCPLRCCLSIQIAHGFPNPCAADPETTAKVLLTTSCTARILKAAVYRRRMWHDCSLKCRRLRVS
jgi:hypothetical protein